jgi:excisionase family DNA binding protein
MRTVFGVEEARTIGKRPASIGSHEDKRPNQAGHKEVGKAMALKPVTLGGEQMSPKLWTVREVAEYLSMSRLTIYQLLSQKRLPCVRISARCVRFDPRQIEAWVAERMEEPKAK